MRATQLLSAWDDNDLAPQQLCSVFHRTSNFVQNRFTLASEVRVLDCVSALPTYPEDSKELEGTRLEIQGLIRHSARVLAVVGARSKLLKPSPRLDTNARLGV